VVGLQFFSLLLGYNSPRATTPCSLFSSEPLKSKLRIKSHTFSNTNFQPESRSFKMSTVDKVKNALHLNKDHSTPSTTHNTGNTVPEGTSGPHTSRVANAADPRIDSDLDNSRTAETSTHDTSGTAGGYTGTGTGVTGTNGGISHSTNSGPHSVCFAVISLV